MSAARAERLSQILILKAEGLTHKQMAERLGISTSLISSVLSDPDGSKERERRKRYGGICVECGGPTSQLYKGGLRASLRCRACTRGLPHHQPPDNRRRMAVRLSEIPMDRRMEAAHEACKVEKGDWERQEILMAAISPSENIYWVAA